MTRAAHDFALTQSAISATSAAPRGVLPAALFDKVGRNIRLTPADHRMLPQARTLVTMTDEIVAGFDDPAAVRSGQVGASYGST